MSEPKKRLGPRQFWRTKVPAPLRHGVVLFAIAIIVEYFVIPEFIGAGKNLHLLARVNYAWLAVALICEGLALFCYALLTRRLLPGGGPGLSVIFRIDLATNAVSHVVPAGSAGSATLGYRLLTSFGVKPGDAAFRIATQGIASAVVLNVMLWCSLVISIPIAGYRPIYVATALVGMLVLLVVAAVVFAFTRGEEVASRFLRNLGKHIPGVGPDRLERVAQRTSSSLRDLMSDTELLRSALLWAVLNWAFDAACLWSFLVAFGRFVDPFELFAAYGIANVLAVIPVTPGGLGLVDSLTPLLLASFGVNKEIAILAVIGWRLVQFWLPIPIGAASYLSLRGPRLKGTKRRDAIREMAPGAQVGPPAPSESV